MLRTEDKIITEKEQDYSFTSYVKMEYLLDKLKILNYEVEFLSSLKMKPIHKYYFMVSKNPGEQFYLFSLLAAWLARKCGRDFEAPHEYDDPNETITKILKETSENGMVIDFSPNKLKQGVGEQVVNILDNLANKAIDKNNIVLQKPKTPEKSEDEIEVIDDESEINLDRVEEEMMAVYSDDSDEENIFRVEDLPTINKNKSHASEMTMNTDEESWKLEIERVLPQLKLTIKNSNRDWRSHLEQMKNYKNNLIEYFGETRNQLEKIHKEITTTLDKVSNREKYLNRELEHQLDNHRTLQDQLSKLKDTYKILSGGVTQRNRELSKMTDQLEKVKQQMEERGSSMTDGTPLVNIKKAVAKVKMEIIDMDVRIGVLECILLQSKIRDQKQLEAEFGQQISVF